MDPRRNYFCSYFVVHMNTISARNTNQLHHYLLTNSHIFQCLVLTFKAPENIADSGTVITSFCIPHMKFLTWKFPGMKISAPTVIH